MLESIGSSRSSFALQIIEGAADAIVAFDPQFRFIFANPAAERLLGLTEGEVLGRSQLEAFPATAGSALETAYRRAMDERVTVNLESFNDISQKWFEVEATPSADAGLVVRFRDITERKHAEAELAKRREHLQELVNDRTRQLDAASAQLQSEIAERTQAGQALREGEERLRFALETSHTAAWDLDLVDHTTYRSLEHDRIFGYQQLLPQWTYEMFLDHVLPEDRAMVDAKFREATAARGDWSFECRIRRVDGEVRWIWAAGRHREDATGSVRRMAGIVQDITERKQAEEALRQSEEHFRALAEALPQIVWTADAQGSIEWFNQRWYDYTGETQGAGEGWSWDRVSHPDDMAHTLENWQDARQRGALFQNEIRVRRHDGQYRWFLVRAWPLHDAEGSVVRWFGANTDVHDMKAAEEALREAKHELEIGVEKRTAELQRTNERLREEIQERIRTEQSLRLEEARLDALLHLSQISEAPLREITEFTLEQAIALTHSKIGFVGFLNDDESVYTLHAVSKDVVKECNVTGDPVQWHVADAGIWADAIRERRTLFVNDYSTPHPRKKGLPPGHPYVERFMVVPILDGQRIAALAGVGNKTWDYDKSDERQIVLLLTGMWSYVQKSRSREELQKAYDELEDKVAQRTAELVRVASELEVRNREVERATRMKSEFLRRMSHELRTPMNAIVGFADLLAEEGEGPLGDTYRRFVRHIQDGACHLLALLDDLLDLSRIEAGRIDLNREWFPPAEAVEEVLSVIAPLAKIKNIAIHNRLVSGVRVNADRTRLKQIFYNLLSNAVKFSQENGRVWIEESSRGDAACFSVGDNGIGIPEEELQAVFEEFHRVRVPSIEGKEGTGLGLAISRRLVQLHGGTLEVESRLGQGSRFSFSLGPASLELAGAAGRQG
jgi:PAS domain S-box-containing protein